VADDQIDRMLDSLEANFDARIARDEDEAASDLALSLLQDDRLEDALCRGAWKLSRPGHLADDIVEVGQDYVATRSGAVVPIRRAVVAQAPATRNLARSTDATFLERLRDHVRAGTPVEITAERESRRGRLLRACVDHLALGSGSNDHGPEEVLIPIAAIEELRARPPGRGDRG
jgi:hypothetical protein